MTEREKLERIFDGWGLEQYIPFHTERAMLADYLLANGVIVPPCKVGDCVYCIVEGVKSLSPMEAKIYSITVQAEGVIMRCGVKGYYGVSYMATDFGKKFFLSREEAEAVLKGVNYESSKAD